MGIITMLSNMARAVAEACGLASKRSDLKNQADVKAAVVKQEQVDVRSEMESAVANEDVNETRKALSD